MSDGFGSYGFLSWLRRGIATGLTTPDPAPLALGQARISLPITVTVSGAPPIDNPVTVSGLYLYGPGEVTGIDTRTVARVWPQPNTSDAETNYFPLIELVPADLPWQYTPSAPETAHRRLRPWFCLIVLKDDEYTLDRQANGAPVLTVKPKTPLPKLSQAWAWAHVQVAGGKSLNGANPTDVTTVQDMLANHPENLVARLLCPRRLDALTRYSAFVVPTFARGALAGIGQPPSDTVDALLQSWSDTDAPSLPAPLQLPVYYTWSFTTGEIGDFEYLVRQLQPNQIPKDSTVGVRPMDVSNPGAGLPGAAPRATPANVLGLEGALKAPNSGTSWSNLDRQAWATALVTLLQAAMPLQTALPLYGRWHAQRNGLNAGLDPSQPLPWFDDLNTDPRLRVAAALGVAVVQAEQQQLMASAWQQAASITEINAELRHAQLGREATYRLYKRHLMPLAPQAALQVAGPVLSRISYTAVNCATNATETHTVSAWLDASPTPRGFFDAQWRRLARLWGGPLGRAGTPSVSNTKSLLDRLMDGTVSPAAHPPMPTGVASMGAAGIDAISLTAAAIAHNGPSKSDPKNYYPTSEGPVVEPAPPAVSDNGGTNWTLFGQAVTSLMVPLTYTPPAATKKCPIASDTLKGAVLAALDPRQTLPAAYTTRLQLAPSGTWRGSDPLGPVYIAPEFPQPAFEPLRKLSQDWVLPGLDQLPPNTITILEGNERFIEAYMVGLNFELGRELLWNGFPTDQRGSYFRQFWDHGSALTATGQLPDPQSRYDIDVITHWSQPLGHNPNPTGLPAGSLFLVVRGDLFRRYPNALLYATKAIIGIDGKRSFPDPNATAPPVEKFPLFSGGLRPDVSFFAFDLTQSDAYGDPSNPNNPNNPGWYFVLQEHAAETRFGLEAVVGATSFNQPVTDWTQMNWGSLAADAASLSSIDYIDLDAPQPDTSHAGNPEDPSTTGLAWHATASPGSGAADIAYVTLRDPYRIAIHASSLLPPPPPPGGVLV
jgi:hypothetical protein